MSTIESESQPSNDNLVASKHLSTKQQIYSGVTYRYDDVFPNQNALTLAPDSVSNYSFTLASGAYDLSESYIEYDLSVAGVAASFTHLHMLPGHIDKIELKTARGQILAKIDNVQAFMKVVYRATTKNSEFQTSEKQRITATDTLDCDRGNLKFPEGGSIVLPPVASAYSSKVINYDGNGYTDPYDSNRSPASFYSSASAGTQYIKVRIPLSEFRHTFLSMPHARYYFEQMHLKISFAKYKTYGYLTTTVSDFTGIADIPVVSLSNLKFKLALVSDQDHINNLMERDLNSNITIPYIETSESNTGSGSSAAISTDVNTSSFERLLRVYSVFSKIDDTGANAVNLNNQEKKMIDSIQTKIDSEQIQNSPLLVANSEIWSNKQAFYKNSSICNRLAYLQSFHFVDDFTGALLVESDKIDRMMSGYQIKSTTKYDVIVQKPAVDVRVIQYAVGQNTLSSVNGTLSVMVALD